MAAAQAGDKKGFGNKRDSDLLGEATSGMDGVSTLASIKEFKACLEKIDPTNSDIDDYVVLACPGVMQGHVNVDGKDKDGIHRAGSKALKGFCHVPKCIAEPDCNLA